MAVFFVNGTEVTVEKNQRLLRYLRDTLHLTSVKDGCSEGACGACTVLVDNIPVDSCIFLAVWADGKTIRTAEGEAKGNRLSRVQQPMWTPGPSSAASARPASS